MYPRNAASPPEIAIGAIVQISNGAVQTTGASVTVKPAGGAESAGGGTLACLGTAGIWTYIPTQAETNYTSFIVSVYKAACLPASATVVTTATATAGTVVVTTNNDKTAYQLATDAVSANALASDAVVELREAIFARPFPAGYGSFSFEQLVELIASVLLAKVSGMGTNTVTFRNLNDTANVVAAVVDSAGNRSSVTRTP